MFNDALYTSRSYAVPPGCRILLYSDGAYEDACVDGRPLSLTEFKDLFTRLHESSLDVLVETLRGLTPSGTFTDDCYTRPTGIRLTTSAIHRRPHQRRRLGSRTGSPR